MKIKNKEKLRVGKKTLVLVIVIASLAIVYSAIAVANNLFPFSKDDSSDVRDYTVNQKRSDAEKAVTDRLEKDPGSKTENSQNDRPKEPPVSSVTNKRQVNVLLTNVSIVSGQVSASGFVTNITETDGRCEYVFRSGNTIIRREVETFSNPTSTTCKTIHFAASELPAPGQWGVELVYESELSSGSSSVKEVSRP